MRVFRIFVSKAKADVFDRKRKTDKTDEKTDFHFMIVPIDAIKEGKRHLAKREF